MTSPVQPSRLGLLGCCKPSWRLDEEEEEEVGAPRLPVGSFGTSNTH